MRERLRNLIMRDRLRNVKTIPLRFLTALRKSLGCMKEEKNPHAVALGRMGGIKGGKARAAKLSPEQRSASARAAAYARWGKQKKKRPKSD